MSCCLISSQHPLLVVPSRVQSSHPPNTISPFPSMSSSNFRYSENWIEGVSGTVHEVGHALYEQGRPGGEAEDLPVSRALTMGVHESQVRRRQT